MQQIPRVYLLDIAYPVVSRICFPHIEHNPFLKAHPIHNRPISSTFRASFSMSTHHGSISPCSVLPATCSPYTWMSKAMGTLRVSVLSGRENRNERTEYLFFELDEPPAELGPAFGLPISLFSPILRDPSLIAEVVEVKGSGAANFESFWGQSACQIQSGTPVTRRAHLLTFLTDHLAQYGCYTIIVMS